jgi:hypothetical protein
VKAEEEEEEEKELIIKSIEIRLLAKTILTITEVMKPTYQSRNPAAENGERQ